MRRLGLAIPVLLAACVAPSAPPPPPPAPAPRPAPPPPPAPPPADWRDRDYTPGDWSYARTAGGSEARYGSPARLSLSCDPRSRQLRLDWPGAQAGPVTVTTSYGDVVRRAQPSPAGLQLTLPARDPVLDQIAFSRGRFMLATGGQALILPAWAEVSRVIEDCR